MSDGASSGGTPPPASSAPAADLAELLARQTRWSGTISLEGGFGFKDNLLLSSTGPEESALARGGVETLWMRPPVGRWEQSVFLQVEGTRFFSGRTVDHEARAWLQSETGWRWGKTATLSLPMTGYYFDQVFDVSDTDVERLIAEMKLSGAMVGPTLRWNLHPDWWFEAQGTGDRKRYDDRLYDARTGEGSVRLGWRPDERFELRAAGARRWRNFDARLQYSAAGRPLANTRLKIDETDAELRAMTSWGRNLAWQATTRAGRLNYRDNGSGYFNYREHRLEQEIEWHDERWLVRVGGAARRVDFDVRTVGIGINPPARLKDEFELSGRLERKLGKAWTLVADYSWERIRSNDPISSYRVNEGLLGVRWTWER